MARLILDTTLLVAAERRRTGLDDLIADEDDVAIAAISAAELLVGVELADPRRRGRREAFVAGILDVLPLEPYDLRVARTHASLLAHVRRTGHPRGAHDLIIAATAVASNRTVATADAKGFDKLPHVNVRLPT